MFCHYLTLSFTVIHILKRYKEDNNFKLNKNVILKTFDSNVRVLFRETLMWIDHKQWETCLETFFKAVFFEKIKIESNFGFLKFISDLINDNKNKKIVAFLF